MNRKDVLKAVRDAGMSATYDTEGGEYRVTFRAADMPDAERREAVASYTSDGADAIGTARAMKAQHDGQQPSDLAARIVDMTAEQRAALVAEVQHWAADAYEQGKRGAQLEGSVLEALQVHAHEDPAGPTEAGGPLDKALAVAIARKIENHDGATPGAINEGIEAWAEVEADRAMRDAFEAEDHGPTEWTPDEQAYQYELMQWQRFNAQEAAEGKATDHDESRHAMTGEDVRASLRARAQAATEAARNEPTQTRRPRGPGLTM